jgi:hypothetical protein
MVERRRDLWERFGPLSGVAAVVLWIIGFLLFLATEVEGADTAAEILAGYESDENLILLAAWLFVLGGVLFLWFLGTLRTRLLAAEGAPGRLTAIAFAAGIATAVFLMSLPLGDVAGALADDLEPAAAQALNEVGTAFFVGAEFSALALVVATALLVLRTGALPRWLGWVSLVLGLLLLIGPIGWLGLIFGFPIWVLVVSFLLWQRGETFVEPAAAVPPPTTETPLST